MLDAHSFAKLDEDFVRSQELIGIAHDLRRDIQFVCHHNAYLVAKFLRRQGHSEIRLSSGYYQCYESSRRIHHSWLAMEVNGEAIAILEFDPRQLYEQGGYPEDLMPSGRIPELTVTITPTARIVDPDYVELTQVDKESRWVVSSKVVLARYVKDATVTPDLNREDLDDLYAEALALFEDWE
jgi:hypothetical protein